MNATTKLRIATFLRQLADRLNPPAQTTTISYSGGLTIYGNTSSPGFFVSGSAGTLGRATP